MTPKDNPRRRDDTCWPGARYEDTPHADASTRWPSTGGPLPPLANSSNTAPESRPRSAPTCFYLLVYRPAKALQKARLTSTSRQCLAPDVNVRTRSGFSAITDEEARRGPGAQELYTCSPRPSRRRRRRAQDGQFRRGPRAAGAACSAHRTRTSYLPDSRTAGRARPRRAASLSARTADHRRFHATHDHPRGRRRAPARRGRLNYTPTCVRSPAFHCASSCARRVTAPRLVQQLIGVPDLTKSAYDSAHRAKPRGAPGAAGRAAPATAETALAPVVIPPTRRAPLPPRLELAYRFQVYTRRRPVAGQPQLTSQARLYRNGQIAADCRRPPRNLSRARLTPRGSITCCASAPKWMPGLRLSRRRHGFAREGEAAAPHGSSSSRQMTLSRKSPGAALKSPRPHTFPTGPTGAFRDMSKLKTNLAHGSHAAISCSRPRRPPARPRRVRRKRAAPPSRQHNRRRMTNTTWSHHD